VNKPFLHSKRVDAELKGPRIIQSDMLKQESMIFVDHMLLIEGIDNDYSLEGQELELHLDTHIYYNKILSIITI